MIFAELSNLHIMIGSALVLIVLGLLILMLRQHAEYEILKTVCKWIGIVVLVIGLILFIIRPLIWIAAQLQNATGVG